MAGVSEGINWYRKLKRLDFGGIRMFGVNVDNKGRRYARACNKVMSGVDF